MKTRSHPAALTAFLPACLLAGAAILAVACGPEPLPELPPRSPARAQAPPVVIVGIDGAEWSIIRKLQKKGALPNLTRLEREGVSASLKTDYGASPVIWTTIATGRRPSVHGITDFVVPTPKGTVPVSSSLRRVPALWNMASRAGLRTAVLGWWASWPAEAIRGVEITDRSHLDLDRMVYPPDYLPAFLHERKRAAGEHPGLGGGLASPDAWMKDGGLRDRIMAHEAIRMAGAGFDLFMVYFRSVDIASHRYWRAWDPGPYGGPDPDAPAGAAGVIPTVYEAVDGILGEILDALPPRSDVFVISDHGFIGGPEVHFVNLDTSALLERLGLLTMDHDAVDFARSTAYPYDSPNHAAKKMIRISLAGREPGGRVPADKLQETIGRVAEALASVTYDNGQPLFTIHRKGIPDVADLVAEVNVANPTMKVRHEGETWDGIVLYINKISGTHNDHTNGIIIARGPDLDPHADAAGISILDIAPTILYALGLPVGEDFPGKARTGLFTPAFRDAHPLRSVPTWGTMKSWKVTTSPEDERLIEELRSLGYL